MHLKFQQSGGLLGQLRGFELDADQLPPALRADVEQILARFGTTGPSSTTPLAAADATQYRLQIDAADKTLRIEVDDLTMPPMLYPLIEYLQEHARPISAQ